MPSPAFDSPGILADDVAPPEQGAVLVRVVAGPMSLDLHAGGNTPIADPTYWYAKYVSLQADGGDLYFAFAPVDTTPIDPASFAFADACAEIPAGTHTDVLMPKDDVTYRYLMLAGTGTLRMWVSSPPGIANVQP